METLTVKKRKEDGSMEELHPKKATLDKTTLKTILFIESEGNVDITSKAQFPKLQTFYKGVASKIKEDGRAETKHYPPIDPESLKEIYTLGGKLVRVFEARESGSQEELTLST